MPRTMKYFIGCSGFHYRDWKGIFYPPDLPQNQWLPYYAEHFNTVEINATFYHFPRVDRLSKWRESVPDHFQFSVKAPRSITHTRKFNQTEAIVQEFYQVITAGLRDKLGGVLFQLPPKLTFSRHLLEHILEQLDSRSHNVLEFRHPSWWNEETYQLLRQHQVAFCILSAPDLPDTWVQTADFLYLRFHGKTAWYRYRYTLDELAPWAEKLRQAHARKAYVYFNNDYEGHAIANANMLKELLQSS